LGAQEKLAEQCSWIPSVTPWILQRARALATWQFKMAANEGRCYLRIV